MALSATGGGGGASARGVRAGRAYVELSAKDGISSALKRVGQRFLEFGKLVLAATGVGGLIGGALGALNLKETLDDLGKVSDVAKAFGITGKAASGLFGVLEAAGGEFKENLEGVIQFSQTVQQAMDGVEGQGAKLFDGLTVQAKELEGLAVDEQFYRVHAAIRELPQGMQEAKLAMLGGTDSMKQWQRLLSMSSEEVRQIARDSAISTRELEDAAQASREMQRAGSAVNRVWQQTVILFAPLVTQLAQATTTELKKLTEWMKGRTLRDVWDEVVALGDVAWVEVSTRARDVWGVVWDWFRSGWDAAVRYARDLFADLATGISGLLVDGFKTALAFFVAGVNSATGLVAKVDPKLATQMAQGAAGAQGFLSGRADAAKAAVAQAAAGLKAVAKQEQEANEELRAAERAAREAQTAQERADAQARLAAVRAEIELRRQARVKEDEAAERLAKMREKVARIDRSVGTFGGLAASFLQSGFGAQVGEGVGKQMVGEQKKTNLNLGRVIDAIQSIRLPTFV